MFKLQPNPSFIAKCPLTVPGQDRPVVVDVEFKHLSRPQLKEFFDGIKDKSDIEALGEIMLSWKGIDAAYSQESLEKLVNNYPTAAGELFETFHRELMEARRKN